MADSTITPGEVGVQAVFPDQMVLLAGLQVQVGDTGRAV